MEKKTSLILMISLGVMFVISIALAGFFFTQYQKVKNNPEVVTKQETEALVEKISKLIDVPNDETPTVATVTDVEKLKDQPFFANAQNDDKILIYTKAKKAIIYRPKEDRLINVGPIAINQQAQVGVALVNAGGDVSVAEKAITEKFGSTVAIVSKTDAQTRTIRSLTVVDTSGQNGEVAKQIADTLGGKVGSLPQGETAPEGSAIVVFVR